MRRRWWPVRGNTGRKCPGEGLSGAPGGSGARRDGGMVQTRSGRRTVTGKEAKSRSRTPASQRKTRRSRVEPLSEVTESQSEVQENVGEKQIIETASQPCPEQPTECSDKLEVNDQCSERTIGENNAETGADKPSKTEVYEINLIDEEANVEEQEDTEKNLNNKTRSATPPIISLQLSSDEDKDTLEDGGTGTFLEESSINVTSKPNVSSEPSAFVPDTAGSPLATGSNLFMIDKRPGADQDTQYYLDLNEEKEGSGESGDEKEGSVESGDDAGDRDGKSEEDDDDFFDEDEHSDTLKKNSNLIKLSNKIDPGLNLTELGGLYINFDPEKQGPKAKAFKKLKEQKESDELLANTILTPEFEKQDSVPLLKESTRQLKKKRRVERAKTAGDGWYNMKAPEITDELKNDLKALKMRAAINPKRFYKKNDREGFPKYFQVGTILDNPVDFYHSRVPKKERKRTMVEELLADAEFRRYNKRKYQQIIAEKTALAAGKKNRKKKKFKN
ncbi:deoxynucleotidyltransferase terminal-interacting protein 2 [Chiloscyllium plagiosum]|uniref:deoxynucleotidyltransferase terminal-interacting protein 2 n=1 Tax=Chiloscyllium plagiosum TaxID=36176 RepID=UPI001CB7B743|nr:deoxynucleotidyltransferase terminal-interacting protein 2 [Chiloscyllium plagiosum]